MPISAEPGVAHDRAHVGEVEVDEAGHGDQVGDALDALAEDVVRHPERLDDRRLLLDHLEQPVVLDHDQRVDVVAQVARCRARACSARRRPSNENGRVTTPTVSAPSSPARARRRSAPRRCRCRRPRRR